MFGQGKRNFNKCPHRKVTYEDPDRFMASFYEIESTPSTRVLARLVCPQVAYADGVTSGPEGQKTYPGALKALGKNAGRIACKDCPFATLSKVELQKHYTELATAEAARLMAEATLKQLQEDPNARIQDSP
jgi:hypothetical protein